LSDIVPVAGSSLPVEGREASFLELAARVTSLTAQALWLKENMARLKRHMENNADEANRLAEMCLQAEVAPEFTAKIDEAATAFRRTAVASGKVADSADQMATRAEGFNAAHQTEYRGIFEAANASDVPMAKPDFYRTR
jgi:hypothetical protein